MKLFFEFIKSPTGFKPFISLVSFLLIFSISFFMSSCFYKILAYSLGDPINVEVIKLDNSRVQMIFNIKNVEHNLVYEYDKKKNLDGIHNSSCKGYYLSEKYIYVPCAGDGFMVKVCIRGIIIFITIMGIFFYLFIKSIPIMMKYDLENAPPGK